MSIHEPRVRDDLRGKVRRAVPRARHGGARAAALYPELPFRALNTPGECCQVTGVRGTTRLDRANDLVEREASIVQLELPRVITGEVDEELAQSLVDVVQRLIQRQTRLRDGDLVQALGRE